VLDNAKRRSIMKRTTRSTLQVIEEQVKKWEMSRKEKKEEDGISVITVSREPGSGGRVVSEGIAKRLKFDLYHSEIIQKMAESADMSARILETLDEKGLSALEDWIAELVNQRHLWPDQYLKHLMKVIGVISKHGRAVIVGRGATFIVHPYQRFSIRVVAPLDDRVKNVSKAFNVPLEEAKRRVVMTESDRRAFTKKYFHVDIANPINYDVVINTGRLSIAAATEAALSALNQKNSVVRLSQLIQEPVSVSYL
jgi:cytidylate kinase